MRIRSELDVATKARFTKANISIPRMERPLEYSGVLDWRLRRFAP